MKAHRSMRAGWSLGLLLAPCLSGCHSAYVEATVQNRGSSPVPLLELDYPSASFGAESLAPGQDFHYRFQVIGSGLTTLTWTDSARQDHKSTGPTLREGAEGPLVVTIDGPNAHWEPHLHNR